MLIFDDPCLDRLAEAYFGARQAEVPNLVKVRASSDLLCQYIVWCLRNGLWEETERPARRPDLRVIINEGPVRHSPRRLSSPLKTDEIRAFEGRVSRVFGIDASAMMEWRADSPLPHSPGINGKPQAPGDRGNLPVLQSLPGWRPAPAAQPTSGAFGNCE